MVKRNAQVSSLGRFRSTIGVVYTPLPSLSGYVSVRIENKRHTMHRLIAAAFELPRAPGQDTVDHIDNNRSNNRLPNLRWLSHSEQTKHSYASNSQRQSNARRLSKPVRARKCGDEAWTVYESGCAAAHALGLESGNVSACCRKRVKQTHNYEFEWAKPTEADTLEGEEWRNVVDSTAAVSSLGRFRSTMGVVSTPLPRVGGYVFVQIENKGCAMHRLIAAAFELPRAPGQDTVDHIDNNPSNNRLSNLRWLSHSEQTKHLYASNSQRQSNARRLSKPVRARKCGDEAWTVYESITAAARALGLDKAHVSACCVRTQKQTGGYEFERAEPTEPDTLEDEEWRDVVLHA